MGLTSRKVLALAVLCAVALFVATVWLWPRLARRSRRAVAGRVVMLLATQLSLFVCVGLAVNRAFGFYADWADLFGQQTDEGVVVEHTADGAADTRLQVVGTQKVMTAGASLPRLSGLIQKVAIEGRRTGIVTPAYVYLPPEYFQPQYRRRTFPVAVVLTGYPGTAQSLISKLEYPRTAHDLVEKGRMQPMVLVMLRPTLAPPRDTECVDVPGGPQTETFFAEDLPDAVLSHYRVGRSAGSWGVIGDSTGGYCALKLAMHHPGRYTVGVGLSAYYKAPIDPTTGDLFHGNTNLRHRADLMWCIKHLPAPRTSLLVTSSRHGERDYKSTLEFIDAVKATNTTRISSIILDSGGHNFTTWKREIPPALEWMSGRLAES
ncbi:MULTISPECIES: alpha/beta hydrolase [Streptomyces]|jgi:enterochelin esterase-like enzyme|uniref:Esterase n=1 Tax=Streptomyces thermoviolaceus subsp. thermoviolaceus TaxID=66860 RepID=A0ABX0YWN1_STRTL|nr:MULTISPECIES: alpha/beta hydrolase-fold protein [Streptomyces]MCM3265400.1 alpha/beta hydrolase-fold protein [Streptomyces thermoviolaceus]NJP16447.1 esterase [Streptomyces thermoviolaceus subsp. thermoviolaceus]RSR99076.1 esterase [Streptomyces sp. WAC00469]WTD48141.1 alpha/beta hydrolase-fold protein [Streptomyces thermoviolaceus]GGV71038.1 esterase [Streptomyces thermoviolaceus subsp. apingens]